MDCQVWIEFLSGSLKDVVLRPMVDILGQVTTSLDIVFFSDASASKKLGIGAILNNRWIRGDWGELFMNKYEPSIDLLELFALCAGIFSWESFEPIVNSRIVIFCDNMAVVHMVNDMSLKCPICMKIIRLLVLNCFRYNRRISAKFVWSKDNYLSDALSRNQMSCFHRLGQHMNETPDEISPLIWPISKIWE